MTKTTTPQAIVAKINSETANRLFVPGLGKVVAEFPFLPDRYKDESGKGNQLVVRADGFPYMRFNRKPDGTWVWALNVDPSKYPAEDPIKAEVFPPFVEAGLRAKLGLTPDSDLMELVDTPVDLEDVIAYATPKLCQGRWA